MKKICSNCGEEFFCYHSQDCWCSSVNISEKLRLFLKDNFSDCLCKNCIERFIVSEKKDTKNNS